MKNKLWAILFVTALLLGLTSLSALAAPLTALNIATGYSIVHLPDDGCYTWGDDVNTGGTGTKGATLPDSGWTWYVYNDNGAYTLTLKGANISTAAHVDGDIVTGIFVKGDLDIVLMGTNIVNVSNVSFETSNGISVVNGSVSVSGSQGAALSVTGKTCGFFASDGDVILKGAAAVTATGDERGVHAANNISMTGGRLTATGTDEYGLYAETGDVTIVAADVRKPPVVTAYGGQYGIYAQQDVIVDGATITATGATESGIHAVVWGPESHLINATVTASGKTFGISRNEKGYMPVGNVFLTARSDGSAFKYPPMIVGDYAYRWKASEINADPGPEMTSSTKEEYRHDLMYKYFHMEPDVPIQVSGNTYGGVMGAVYQLGDGGVVVARIGTGTKIGPGDLQSVLLIKDGVPRTLEEGVEIDVTSGSIVVTLYQSFLETLVPGTYILRAQLKNPRIDVDAPFTVLGNAPKTGDEAPVALWAMAMLLGCFGAAWAARKRRTRA